MCVSLLNFIPKDPLTKLNFALSLSKRFEGLKLSWNLQFFQQCTLILNLKQIKYEYGFKSIVLGYGLKHIY